MPQQKTYTVYKFDELSEEAKQTAIDKWYESEDYPFLEDDIKEELDQLDTLKIFKDVRLQYSLSCCQGDGLSFSANIDIDAYLRFKKYSEKNIEALNEHIYKFISTGNKGRYPYASKTDIQWEDQGNDVPASTEEEIEQIRQEIADYYFGICKRLEKYGYSVLEYRMDKTEFSEMCESNNYLFLANGTLD